MSGDGRVHSQWKVGPDPTQPYAPPHLVRLHTSSVWVVRGGRGRKASCPFRRHEPLPGVKDDQPIPRRMWTGNPHPPTHACLLLRTTRPVVASGMGASACWRMAPRKASCLCHVSSPTATRPGSVVECLPARSMPVSFVVISPDKHMGEARFNTRVHHLNLVIYTQWHWGLCNASSAPG
jgi:hypothetical protein